MNASKVHICVKSVWRKINPTWGALLKSSPMKKVKVGMFQKWTKFVLGTCTKLTL